MPPDCQPVADHLPSTRARLTNHRDLLPGLDGRSPGARRFRDLVNAFIADQGGAENCSEVKLGLVRRLAAASVLAEMLEVKAVAGELIDVSEFCNLASTTVRLSQRLGINRVPKNVTPSIKDYIASITSESMSEDAA
jgi:hypothetical protein